MNDRTPLYIENRNSFTDRDTHIIYNLLGSYYLLYDIAYSLLSTTTYFKEHCDLTKKYI